MKLTTRLGQDIEGEVLSHDEGERALLVKRKVDLGDIETRACNIHLGKFQPKICYKYQVVFGRKSHYLGLIQADKTFRVDL